MPGTETVRGLANRKNRALLVRLEQHGVTAYAGARLYLELAQDAGLKCAVVSGSTNTETLLSRARLSDLVAGCVDGRTMLSEGLERKPAPDMLLAACRHLGVAPDRTAVFETTHDGIVAGRAGGFRLVVAVHQDGQRRDAARPGRRPRRERPRRDPAARAGRVSREPRFLTRGHGVIDGRGGGSWAYGPTAYRTKRTSLQRDGPCWGSNQRRGMKCDNPGARRETERRIDVPRSAAAAGRQEEKGGATA